MQRPFFHLGASPIGLAILALGVIDPTSLRAASSLEEALELDIQGRALANSAPAWACEAPAGSHDGVDAASSSPIGHSQAVGFEIAVEGPDTVSFWWKVSSELNYDFVRFLVDGSVDSEMSGSEGWTRKEVDIPEGGHTLRWEYAKDHDSTEGADRAWIDEIRFASTSVPLIDYPDSVGAYLGEPFAVRPETFGTIESFSITSGTLPGTVTLDPATGRLRGILQSTDPIAVSVSAHNATGASEPAQITIEMAPALSGVGDTVQGWRWTGAAPWFSQGDIVHAGSDALRSGDIGDGESSDLLLPVTGPAIVKFWWRVDSEGAHDKLAFLVDGSPTVDTHGAPMEIDDLVEWEQRTVTIPDGEHILAWRYQKDAAQHEGADAAWIDEIIVLDGTDSDADGIPSIAEAFLGFDPQIPDGSRLPLPTDDAGRLRWELPRAPDTGNFVPIVEFSGNLVDWSSQEMEIITDDPTRLVILERTASPSQRKFVRLMLSIPTGD